MTPTLHVSSSRQTDAIALIWFQNTILLISKVSKEMRNNVYTDTTLQIWKGNQ